MPHPLTRIAVAALLLLPALVQADVRTLEWLDLMPEDEAQAWIDDQTNIDHSGFDAPEEPFQSFRTVGELDGQHVRLPGFVVPIETNEDGDLVEFFLVPYFGACIHLPPPPANQIIYGRLDEPMEMIDIWDAFWMEGTLNIEDVSNETAASAYTMDVESLTLYD